MKIFFPDETNLFHKVPNILKETLTFLDSQRLPSTGLTESFHESSRYLYNYRENQFSLKNDGYLENQCFTYDEALSVIAYSLLEKFEKAKAILNLLNFNFHIGKGDKVGLFNSYRGNGFCVDGKTLIMGIDGDRLHAGPNLWVGIACYQYMLLSGDKSFFPLCIEIIKWTINKLQHFQLKDGRRGGISMGFGWGPDWQKVYSTENNADYYALLNIIDHCYHEYNFAKQVFEQQGLQLHEVQREKKGVEEWLSEAMYNSELGFLNAGFNENGLDTTKALDTVTFTILAFSIERLLELKINPELLIRNAEDYLKVEVTHDKQKYYGFDFTDADGLNLKRDNLIWVEGTYQMVLTYQVIAKYFQKKGELEKSKLYIDKASQHLQDMEVLISYTNNQYHVPSYSSVNPKEMEVIMTFKDEWEIPRGKERKCVPAVVSTVWRMMSFLGFNPMSKCPILNNAMGKNKLKLPLLE